MSVTPISPSLRFSDTGLYLYPQTAAGYTGIVGGTPAMRPIDFLNGYLNGTPAASGGSILPKSVFKIYCDNYMNTAINLNTATQITTANAGDSSTAGHINRFYIVVPGDSGSNNVMYLERNTSTGLYLVYNMTNAGNAAYARDSTSYLRVKIATVTIQPSDTNFSLGRTVIATMAGAGTINQYGGILATANSATGVVMSGPTFTLTKITDNLDNQYRGSPPPFLARAKVNIGSITYSSVAPHNNLAGGAVARKPHKKTRNNRNNFKNTRKNK